MFSSKRHRSVPSQTSGYHYSDPTHLDLVEEHQPRQKLDSAPASSAAGIVTRGTALTSHSVTYHPPHVVQEPLPIPPRRGRRNTLPSLVYDDKESTLQPPVIRTPTQDFSRHKSRSQEENVTSRQFKRRSRSADALLDLVRHDIGETSWNRDRAGEIAYWRNSAIENPVPVYSGQSIAIDPIHLFGPDTSAVDSEQYPPLEHPMQAFDFGLEDTTCRDVTTLEQRVNTLEIKLFDFEYAIAKLQGNDIPKPDLNSRSFTRPAAHEVFHDNVANATFSSVSSHELSYVSSPATAQDGTFLNSPEESPVLSPDSGDLFRSQRASKATTATIRPVTARQRSPQHSRETSDSSIHIPAEKMLALMELIKDEKAARQKLEEKVMQLQKEVEGLRTPVYATIREAYPTPSRESTYNGPILPRTKTLHRTQPFQLLNPAHEISRFSGTEDSDEEGFEDVYETPEENRHTFETARGSPPMAVV